SQLGLKRVKIWNILQKFAGKLVAVTIWEHARFFIKGPNTGIMLSEDNLVEVVIKWDSKGSNLDIIKVAMACRGCACSVHRAREGSWTHQRHNHSCIAVSSGHYRRVEQVVALREHIALVRDGRS